MTKHFAITRAQREALFKVFQRDFPSWLTPTKRLDYRDVHKTVRVPSVQWRRFRRQVLPGFDGSGCIMLPWRGMILGIETDGHTHS